VATLIEVSDPPASVLLQKPVGDLGHGGGPQLVRGGAEVQILEQWVELVTRQGCGGNGGPGGGGGGGGGSPGATLYGAQCASCHGTDARGVGGRPRILCNRDVSAAVKSGRPGPTAETTMPPFPRLTDADIALIQGHLDALCPAATASGADLFAGNCASCHGTDARGKTGPDVHCARSIGDAVRNGVRGVFGSMRALMRVTDPEIARIQSHLLALCPLGSATGAELYTSNCAGCHGTTAEGDADRRPNIRCTVPSRIGNAVRKGRGFSFPVMPSFPSASLTDPELASIVGFANGFCSGQPAALYASNCATCHGPTGTGGENANEVRGPNIRCASSSDIFDAVVDGYGGMPAFNDMTNAQINAIVTFLRSGC
jgi:mono/diheme cytochrome c family protein